MTTTAPGPTRFRDAFRRWRQHRKLSQLELALAAGVSQRHLSWLETGRSQPSREMVIRLSEAMAVPLRERNALLRAAGYAAHYTEKRLDEPGMEPVLDAVRRMLDHHDPYPAVAVDRFWNVTMHNRAAAGLLGLVRDPTAMTDPASGSASPNLALLSLHPEGLRPLVRNWDRIAPSFVRRLREEAVASGDRLVRERFEHYIALSGVDADAEVETDGLLPILPLELEVGGQGLRMFTVISTVGTPQDVTADELRIEAFFPADAETDRLLRAAGK